MNALTRRVVQWVLLGGVALALMAQVDKIWPRENRLVIRLPEGRVRVVELELSDDDGDVIRRAQLFPRGAGKSLERTFDVPRGDYRLELAYELAGVGEVDKNHGRDWTRLGVVHQIRFEGGTHRLPPPTELP